MNKVYVVMRLHYYDNYSFSNATTILHICKDEDVAKGYTEKYNIENNYKDFDYEYEEFDLE